MSFKPKAVLICFLIMSVNCKEYIIYIFVIIIIIIISISIIIIVINIIITFLE